MTIGGDGHRDTDAHDEDVKLSRPTGDHGGTPLFAENILSEAIRAAHAERVAWAEAIDERSTDAWQASTTDHVVDILQEATRAYRARLDGVPIDEVDVDTPFWRDLVVEQAKRLRANAVDTGATGGDGRSDRPGLGATLSRAADLLLEVTRVHQARFGDGLPVADDRLDRWALESIKTLMTAGWSAPDERTIGIPNGLVLHEAQWHDLSAGHSAWVITPGGEQALELRASSFQSPPSAEVREAVWLQREVSRETPWGAPTEARYDPREVTVPRSFLTFLVQLAHELRIAGDFTAANSLDNALAVVAPELRQAGIAWRDGGGATPASAASPERSARTRARDAFGGRERRTHTATNYFEQLQNAARVHADALHGLWPSTWLDPWSDEEFRRDVTTVLEYVSGGHTYAWINISRYPEFAARRALGRLGDTPRDAPRGTSAPGGQTPIHPVEVDDVIVGKWLDAFAERYPHLATAKRIYQPLERYEELQSNLTTASQTIDDLQRRLAQAQRDLQDERRSHEFTGQSFSQSQIDNQRTKNALIPLLVAHPQTRDDVGDENEASSLRAGYVAEQATTLIRWYEAELERVKREFAADGRLRPPSTWARTEGMRLLDYAGWDREGRDFRTPITRTQFLELAELCTWELLTQREHVGDSDGKITHDVDDTDESEETNK